MAATLVLSDWFSTAPIVAGTFSGFGYLQYILVMAMSGDRAEARAIACADPPLRPPVQMHRQVRGAGV